MGESYGIVYIRSEGIESVCSACAAVSAASRVKFYVAAPERGWVAVYPSDAGQDPTVSESLAQRLGGPVLHMVLHDSDLVAYSFFREGVLLDSFVSIPDYFEDMSEEERRQVAGRPELLAEILPAGTSVDDLRALLSELRSEDDRVVAFRGLRGFRLVADCLNLPGERASYESLEDSSARRRGLVQVPDPAIERAARRAARAAQREEKRILMANHVLLFAESKNSRDKYFGLHPDPVVTRNTPQDGFLMLWSTGNMTEEAPLLVLEPPWNQPPRETGITLSCSAYTMAVTPGGETLAVGHASGSWKIEVWNLRDRVLSATWPIGRAGSIFEFSPGADLLAYESEQTVHVAESRTGEARYSFPTRGNEQFGAFHPKGKYFVYVRPPELVLFDLEAGKEVAALRSEARDERVWLTAAPSGEGVCVFHHYELPARFCFDVDGQQLAVATNEGPRVYSWEDLLASREKLPAPIRHETCPVVLVDEVYRMQGTHSVAFDGEGRLFYCGLEGAIGMIDAHGSRPTAALQVPGSLPLFALQSSRDGCSLAVVARPRMFTRRRDPAELQVWSSKGIQAALNRVSRQ